MEIIIKKKVKLKKNNKKIFNLLDIYTCFFLKVIFLIECIMIIFFYFLLVKSKFTFF